MSIFDKRLTAVYMKEEESGVGSSGEEQNQDGNVSDDSTTRGESGNEGVNDNSDTSSDSDSAIKSKLKALEEEKAELLKETMQRKKALREQRESAEKLQNEIETWKSLGVKPEDVKQYLEEAKKAEEKSMLEKGEFNKLRERMQEEHDKQVATFKEQVAKLSEEKDGLSSQINQLTVGSSFSSSEFIQKNLLVPPAKAKVLWADHFEVTPEGEVMGYDKPVSNSNRKPHVDAHGNPLPFDVALERIIESDPDKDAILRAKAKPGAGTKSSPTSGKTVESQNTDVRGRSRIAIGLDQLVKKTG